MLSSASFNALSEGAWVRVHCFHGNFPTEAALSRTVSVYVGLNVCVTQLSQCCGAGWAAAPSTAGGWLLHGAALPTMST